jgi:hypothetical protein
MRDTSLVHMYDDGRGGWETIEVQANWLCIQTF